MASYRIASVHAGYARRSGRSQQLLDAYKTSRTNSGGPVHVRDVEEVASLCLLRVSLSWESFIEDCFLRYMCGAASVQGNVPQAITATPIGLNAAFSQLAGTRRYLNWSANETVTRSNRYFLAGGPFNTPIAAVANVMADMQAVRNRMAHRSDYSKQEFNNSVIAHIGFVPRGITPGRFVLMQTANTNGLTIFEYFLGNIDAAALAIANF